jgi:hypothetical protein
MPSMSKRMPLQRISTVDEVLDEAMPLLYRGKGYSIFDSTLDKNLDAEWHFPQEKSALHDFVRSHVNRKCSSAWPASLSVQRS